MIFNISKKIKGAMRRNKKWLTTFYPVRKAKFPVSSLRDLEIGRELAAVRETIASNIKNTKPSVTFLYRKRRNAEDGCELQSESLL